MSDNVNLTHGDNVSIIEFEAKQEDLIEIAKGLARISKEQGLLFTVVSGDESNLADFDVEDSTEAVLLINGFPPHIIARLNQLIRRIFEEDADGG